jgi:hypothetical protein
MVALPPATPYTTPVVVTVATAVLPDDHEPPPVALLSVVESLAQTVVVPVMDAGMAGTPLIVTPAVVKAVPQLPVTV